MLVKYYLSDNIKAPFEDFSLDCRNAWADFVCRKQKSIYAAKK